MLDIYEMGKKKRGGGERERERNKSSKVQSILDYTVYTHSLYLSTARLLLAVPNIIQHYDF